MLIRFEPSIETLEKTLSEFREGATRLIYTTPYKFQIEFIREWLVANGETDIGNDNRIIHYMELAIEDPPVYEGDLNLDNLISNYYKEYYPDIVVGEYHGDNTIAEYGVADSPEQLLADYVVQMDFVNSSEEYICYFTWILKSDQPSRGGWRWHKWGEYIGKQKPSREYLYDEPDIDAVIVFHFLRINSNVNTENYESDSLSCKECGADLSGGHYLICSQSEQ